MNWNWTSLHSKPVQKCKVCAGFKNWCLNTTHYKDSGHHSVEACTLLKKKKKSKQTEYNLLGMMQKIKKSHFMNLRATFIFKPPFAWRAPAHRWLAGLGFFIYKGAPINSAPSSCWTGPLGQSRPPRCQHTVPTGLVLTCWKRDPSLKVDPPHPLTHPHTFKLGQGQPAALFKWKGINDKPKQASEA